MKKVPSKKEWKGYEKDIDASYAFKLFYGKTNAEVQDLLRKNVIESVDEIRFMPIGAFQYYIFALRDYVMKREFEFYDSSDAASCFIGLVLEKLRESPEFILPIIDELLPAVEFVAKNQTLYDADEDIYGDFQTIYNSIIKLSNK